MGGKAGQRIGFARPAFRTALPADHRARVEALRADAWFQKGEPLRAVDLYTQRENWLDNPQAIDANRQRLWAGLIVSDTQTLKNAAEVAYDPIARGWLSLAALANSTGQQGIGWGNGVIRWQENYHRSPRHRRTL